MIPSDGVANGTSLQDSEMVGNEAPTFSNVNSTTLTPEVGSTVYVFADWNDDIGLDTAILELNNSGNVLNVSNQSLTGTDDLANFSIDTSAFFGIVYWRIWANDTDGLFNSAMNFSNFTVVDTTTPDIDVSNISGASPSGISNETWFFTATDNFKLNMTTLFLNVSGVNTTYHRIAGSDIFNSSLNFSTDISCSGSNTLQNCSLTLNLSNGFYNLTFIVNDTSDNQNITQITNYVVDTTTPSIDTVSNGYVLSGVATSPAILSETNHLYANWSDAIIIFSSLDHYEVAVGTEQYPTSGYNNIQSFTNVGQNTTFNDTFSLNSGQEYYFSVRVVSTSGKTNVTSSSGILFEDNSAPVCVGGGPSCVINEGKYTRSTTQLSVILNFIESQSSIILYQYAIGTIAYPQPGWDSVVSTTDTTLNNITATGLSLTYNRTYYWSARAQNEDNRWSDWKSSDNITVDNVAPFNGSLSYTAINLTVNTTTLTLDSGTDEVSGVSNVVVQEARSLVEVQESTCGGFGFFTQINSSLDKSHTSLVVDVTPGFCYKYRYIVFDFAGNARTYTFGNELVFFVDNTPPEGFTVTLNRNAFFVQDNDWDINISTNPPGARDNESGIAYYTFKLNGTFGALIDFTNTTSNFIQGLSFSNNLTHLEEITATVIAFNGVGLSTQETSNTVLFKDLTIPDPVTVVSVEDDVNGTDGFINNVNGTTTNLVVSGEADLTCIYSEQDIAYSTVFGDSCEESIGTNVSCLINVTEGRYTYYIACKDTAGNQQDFDENTRVDFTVDVNSPVIDIQEPSQGETVGGIIDITVNITDAGIGSISSARYLIFNTSDSSQIFANATLSIPITGGIGSTTFDSNSLFNVSFGNATIFVSANDTLGKTNNATTNFTIDNTIPTVDIDLDTLVNANTTLNFTVQNFVNASYNITNSSGVIVQSDVNESATSRIFLLWQVIANVSALSDGNYTVNLLANNFNGNVTTDSAQFIIDRTNPQFNNFTVVPSVINNDDQVNITINWTDNNDIDDFNTVYIQHNANGSFVNYTATEISQDLFQITINASGLSNNETVNWTSIGIDEAGNINDSMIGQSFTVQNRNVTSVAVVTIFFRFNESKLVDLSTFFSDEDGDNLTFAGAPNGTFINYTFVNLTTINVTANQTGTEGILFNATDGFGGFSITNFTFTATNQTLNITSVTNTSITTSGVVINWTTTTSANSSLIINGSSYSNSSSLVTSHSISVIGLLQNSTYEYSVESCNATVCESSGNFLFTTLPFSINNDVTASSIGSVSVTIGWTTNGSSNGTVSLNNTGNSGVDSTNDTTKSIGVTGLSVSTDYSYNVTSCYLEETPTICITDGPFFFNTSAATPSSSGGGGGGGGSSSYGTVTQGTNFTDLVPEFTSYSVGVAEIIEYELGGFFHILKVVTIFEDRVTLVVQSTQQVFELFIGETRQVDLTGDLIKDIEVRLVSIVDGRANLLIRTLNEGETFAPLQDQEFNAPQIQEEREFNAPPSRLSAQGEGKASPIRDNILGSVLALFIALTLLGGLVMKEKTRLDFINSKPELKAHQYMRKIKKKGHKTSEAQKMLLKGGWPKIVVNAALLQEIISELRAKGHSHTMIKHFLKSKGVSDKKIYDVVLNSYLSDALRKGKSIPRIKSDLKKAGWDKELLDQKFSK